MIKAFACAAVVAVLLLGGSACSAQKSSDDTGPASKVTTAPINSSIDVAPIRGKVDRAAVAADLQTMMTNSDAASAMSGGETQQDRQAAYQTAVQQIATKYGITVADVQDIANQYRIAP